MKIALSKPSAWLLASLALAGCGAPAGPMGPLPAGFDKRREAVPDEIVVKYRPPAGIRAEATLFPEDIPPLRPREVLPGTLALDRTSFESRDDLVLLRVPAGQAAEVAATYRARPDVAWAVPNARIQVPSPGVPGMPDGPGAGITDFPLIGRIGARSNDTLADRQWGLERVGAADAWATATGAGVLVAILDTGIDDAHPDLAGAVERGPSFVAGGDSMDRHGHGTHVAGIVGARKDNGIGIAGIAPGCSLLAVRVLDENGRSGIFSVARGIKAAADHGKRTGKRVVINLSLGASLPVDPLDFLAGWYANRQGALLVAAAGNEGGAVSVPAKHRYFVAVAATDARDARASFSNFGPQLALSAPGVDIVSTTPTYPVTMTQRGVPASYAALAGTSMATPIVSGVAALVWSRHPEWTPAQVRDALTRTARSLGDKTQFGAGLVDARGAVAQ